jgi:hypothetical protein
MRNMKMKMKRALTIVFLLLILFTISSPAYSNVVRGMLYRVGPYGRYPAVNVLVTLYSRYIGRSARSYTSRDGMYYFYNVPEGKYVLEIWGYGPDPIIYPFEVFNQPYNDGPRVRVP